MGKELFARLLPIQGYLGVIEWRKGDDVYVIDRQGAPLYLQKPGSLKTPFSIALNPFPATSEGAFEFNLGDLLHKRDTCIFRSTDGKPICDLSQPVLVDLNRALAPCPAAACRKLLYGEVLRAGSFEGLAGLLVLIPEASADAGDQGCDGRVSPWCRSALDAVLLVLGGARTKDAQMLLSGCNKLIGLGPGLTPSGDDLLLGFFATHRIWASALWQMIIDSRLNASLQASAGRTHIISSTLLRAALQGTFAEIIYDLFESLSYHPEKTAAQADKLLRIGHASGTDLLTGIILGLMTL